MREFWVAVGLLWLAGVGLRLTILAVPPVIALIQNDLQLSGTEVGILSGLPVDSVRASAALPGSLLIARFGALADAGRRLAHRRRRVSACAAPCAIYRCSIPRPS